MVIARSVILLLFFVVVLLPNSGWTVNQNQNSSYSELDKTYESSGKQKKKIKEKYKNLTKRKKMALFVFLPLFLISFLLLSGVATGGTKFVGFAFLSLACLLAFIFSLIKNEDAAIKVGNILLIIATTINLIASWIYKKFGGG